MSLLFEYCVENNKSGTNLLQKIIFFLSSIEKFLNALTKKINKPYPFTSSNNRW